VNQTVRNFSIEMWQDPVFSLREFPIGLYQVPKEGLAKAKLHGFNMVTCDNYTATCGTSSDNSWTGYLHNMLPDWLEEAHNLALVTAPGWLGSGDMACPACRREDGPTGKGWQDRIERCFAPQYRLDPGIKDLIDLVSLVDEPMPIDTHARRGNLPDWEQKDGCTLEGQAPFTFAYPILTYRPSGGVVNLEDYIQGKEEPYAPPWQPFFGSEGFSEEYRLKNMVLYFLDIPVSDPPETFRPGKPVPLFINQLSQGNFSSAGFRLRNRNIWAAFMQYCHYFSVDLYPDLAGKPLSEVAMGLDQMHQAREEMWRGEGPFRGGWPYSETRPYWWACMAEWRLPKLWFVLHFGDWWNWKARSRGEAGEWVDEIAGVKDYGGVGRCAAPTEYKAMAYLAVTHGAKGLLFHRFPENERNGYRPPFLPAQGDLPEGVPYFDESPNCAQQWTIAAYTNSELKTLGPIINAADSRDALFIAEMPVVTPLGSSPELVLARIEETVGPIESAQRPEILNSICRSLDKLSLDGGMGLQGTQPVENRAEQAAIYEYRIHCLGRTGTSMHSEIHPKQVVDQNCIITVNGTQEPVIGIFTCMWVPGFHRAIPAMEVEGYYAELMFEWEMRPPSPLPVRRRIPLALVGRGAPPWFPRFVFFVDGFGPYQRHVYKVQSSAWDPVVTQLQGVLVERLPELRQL